MTRFIKFEVIVCDWYVPGECNKSSMRIFFLSAAKNSYKYQSFAKIISIIEPFYSRRAKWTLHPVWVNSKIEFLSSNTTRVVYCYHTLVLRTIVFGSAKWMLCPSTLTSNVYSHHTLPVRVVCRDEQSLCPSATAPIKPTCKYTRWLSKVQWVPCTFEMCFLPEE